MYSLTTQVCAILFLSSANLMNLDFLFHALIAYVAFMQNKEKDGELPNKTTNELRCGKFELSVTLQNPTFKIAFFEAKKY